MKSFVCLIFLVLSSFVGASPMTITRPSGPEGILTLTQTTPKELGQVAEDLHHQTGRCGVFVASFEGEFFNNPSQN